MANNCLRFLYKNMHKKKKYYIVGPYPPPYGGVSVFIYRYSKLLEKQGIDVLNMDFHKCGIFKKILFLLNVLMNPSDVTYHINSIHFSLLIAIILRIFPCKTIFYAHSSTGMEQQSGLRNRVFSKFLKRTDECIFVANHILGKYQTSGYELPKNTIIKNPFIPPPFEEEASIWNSYDTNVRSFIDKRSPLIIANAYRITLYNTIDLYGIDMCVELTRNLTKKFPNMGFLFTLAEIGNPQYFSEINRRIIEYGIKLNFLFLTGQKEIWPIFNKCQLMIRPTYSDGNSVSLSEALFFGCKAIASDVCLRPEGTILFRNRDISDLLEKVERCLGT